jgi:type IV secretory pathway TraG/TraD family ATPase VirD4
MMEKAKNAFALYSKGARLRDFVSVDPTNPEAQVWEPGAHKKIPHAAYLIFPPKYVRSHGQFASVFFDYVIRSLRDTTGNVRTTLVLDEIGNFSQVMAIPEALMLLRSYGIRIFAAVQDRLSLQRCKEVGGSKLFESQSIQLLSMVSDTAHAKEIEQRAGYHTEVTPSYQISIGMSGNVGSISGSETRIANLSVHDIAMLGKRHAIFIAPGVPFGVFERPVYCEIPWLADDVKDIREEPGAGGLNHG